MEKKPIPQLVGWRHWWVCSSK